MYYFPDFIIETKGSIKEFFMRNNRLYCADPFDADEAIPYEEEDFDDALAFIDAINYANDVIRKKDVAAMMNQDAYNYTIRVDNGNTEDEHLFVDKDEARKVFDKFATLVDKRKFFSIRLIELKTNKTLQYREQV